MSNAAAACERVERLPLAAYCRWRLAEALAAVGANATVPREAHMVARIARDRCWVSSSDPGA